jgi:hypothetical protein
LSPCRAKRSCAQDFRAREDKDDRKAANKYAELAKHAEPDYLAETYRKVAVRYVFMAEDLLKWSERRRELDVNGLAGTFLDRPASRWVGR